MEKQSPAKKQDSNTAKANVEMTIGEDQNSAPANKRPNSTVEPQS